MTDFKYLPLQKLWKQRVLSRIIVPAAGIVVLASLLAYLVHVTPWQLITITNPPPSVELNDHTRRIDTRVLDPLADLPRQFRGEITKATGISTAEFSRRFIQPIDRLCRTLELAGFGSFVVVPDPITEGQQVCSGEIIPATQVTEASSVFVWMRSSKGGMINLIGVKLNLRNPGTAAAATSEAGNVLKAIHHALRWDLPQQVLTALRDMRAVDSYAHFGTVYQLRREWSVVPRYNVIIEIRDRSGVIEDRSFQPK